MSAGHSNPNLPGSDYPGQLYRTGNGNQFPESPSSDLRLFSSSLNMNFHHGFFNFTNELKITKLSNRKEKIIKKIEKNKKKSEKFRQKAENCELTIKELKVELDLIEENSKKLEDSIKNSSILFQPIPKISSDMSEKKQNPPTLIQPSQVPVSENKTPLIPNFIGKHGSTLSSTAQEQLKPNPSVFVPPANNPSVYPPNTVRSQNPVLGQHVVPPDQQKVSQVFPGSGAVINQEPPKSRLSGFSTHPTSVNPPNTFPSSNPVLPSHPVNSDQQKVNQGFPGSAGVTGQEQPKPAPSSEFLPPPGSNTSAFPPNIVPTSNQVLPSNQGFPGTGGVPAQPPKSYFSPQTGSNFPNLPIVDNKPPTLLPSTTPDKPQPKADPPGNQVPPKLLGNPLNLSKLLPPKPVDTQVNQKPLETESKPSNPEPETNPQTSQSPPQIFSGSPPFSGSAPFSPPFSGQPPFSGPPAFSGPPSFPGSNRPVHPEAKIIESQEGNLHPGAKLASTPGINQPNPVPVFQAKPVNENLKIEDPPKQPWPFGGSVFKGPPFPPVPGENMKAENILKPPSLVPAAPTKVPSIPSSSQIPQIEKVYSVPSDLKQPTDTSKAGPPQLTPMNLQPPPLSVPAISKPPQIGTFPGTFNPSSQPGANIFKPKQDDPNPSPNPPSGFSPYQGMVPPPPSTQGNPLPVQPKPTFPGTQKQGNNLPVFPGSQLGPPPFKASGNTTSPFVSPPAILQGNLHPPQLFKSPGLPQVPSDYNKVTGANKD